MNRNNIYILKDRGFYNGDDAKEFLQNIITNNIVNVSDDNRFSALTTTRQISLRFYNYQNINQVFFRFENIY